MTKKKQEPQYHYEIRPEVKQAYAAAKSAFGFLTKNRKELELEKLQKEVTKLETQETIDTRIRALQAKKKQLKEKLEKNDMAYA